jgi:hypothetical protein
VVLAALTQLAPPLGTNGAKRRPTNRLMLHSIRRIAVDQPGKMMCDSVKG